MEERIKKLILGIAPNLKFVHRDHSPLMKVLDVLMFWNPTWKEFTISLPPWRIYYNDKTGWRVLAHEYVHVFDMHEKPVRYILWYLFPQVLAVLAPLGLIGLIWTPWAWFSLLFLLALAPWPSPGRVYFEGRGYAMSRLAARLVSGHWNDGEAYKTYFTGPAYYFMSWNWGKVARELAKYVDIQENSRDKKMVPYVNVLEEWHEFTGN